MVVPTLEAFKVRRYLLLASMLSYLVVACMNHARQVHELLLRTHEFGILEDQMRGYVGS
jgi:hypothetical protein